jgi:hypothetical protein
MAHRVGTALRKGARITRSRLRGTAATLRADGWQAATMAAVEGAAVGAWAGLDRRGEDTMLLTLADQGSAGTGGGHRPSPLLLGQTATLRLSRPR